MSDFKACPYCAEQIRSEAVRCRFCRSRLAVFEQRAWRRPASGRRFAGVAAGLADAFSVPVGAVRFGFVVATFIHLLGPLVYGACWLIMPEGDGGQPPAQGLLRKLRTWLQQVIDSLPEEVPSGPARPAKPQDASVGGEAVVNGGNAER